MCIDYFTYIERYNCSSDSDEFKSSRIIEKKCKFDLVIEIEET